MEGRRKEERPEASKQERKMVGSLKEARSQEHESKTMEGRPWKEAMIEGRKIMEYGRKNKKDKQ